MKQEKYSVADECFRVRNNMIDGFKVSRDNIDEVRDCIDKCKNLIVKVKILSDSIAQSGGQTRRVKKKKLF